MFSGSSQETGLDIHVALALHFPWVAQSLGVGLQLESCLFALLEAFRTWCLQLSHIGHLTTHIRLECLICWLLGTSSFCWCGTSVQSYSSPMPALLQGPIVIVKSLSIKLPCVSVWPSVSATHSVPVILSLCNHASTIGQMWSMQKRRLKVVPFLNLYS